MVCNPIIKPIKADLQEIVVSPSQSIQEAINNANAGDMIFVQSGTYSENVILNKSISLIGENPSTTLIDGGGHGNVLTITSSNVWVKNFTIQNGGFTEQDKGSSLQIGTPTGESVNVSICYNVIKLSYHGIRLLDTNNSKIRYNSIMNNSAFGIYFSGSSGNSIVGNTIVNHITGVSIATETSIFNSFYHNNFVNNTYVQMFAPTHWDDGYPSGGNYWSDYDGVDKKSGLNQDELGSDGIGDTPYPDIYLKWDKYPLIGPIAIFTAGTWDEVSYNVDVVSNSTISDFYFNSKSAFIRFNVTGESGTVGFCRVVIPQKLLWVEDGWTIYVEGLSVNYTIIPNENYTYLYFIYNHTTKTVLIQGTHAITEFLSIRFLLLFITITLFVVILMRKFVRKLSRTLRINESFIREASSHVSLQSYHLKDRKRGK